MAFLGKENMAAPFTHFSILDSIIAGECAVFDLSDQASIRAAIHKFKKLSKKEFLTRAYKEEGKFRVWIVD